MQFRRAVGVVALGFVSRAFGAQFQSVRSSDSPVPQVVALIEELRAKVEADGKVEQGVYDKYACWCEDTLGEKAAAISKGKETIEELQALIVKLKSQVAIHSENIKQLNKDIANNIEAQKEAEALRTKELSSYNEEKLEGEQCIGALEAAITVLTGAGGSGKKELAGFQQAQVLSVVAGIRKALGRAESKHSMSDDDLSVIRSFVENPDGFMHGRTAGAFLQVSNNPFGDYAPQSGRVQGILKGMYDTFASDLEKANAEEAEKAKGFAELMATKKAEEKTLKATLLKTESDEAEATKGLADSKSSLDDTVEQLAADEEFFATTKSSCKQKAQQWAERTRLRTEEMHGMDTAVKILSGGLDTFHNASTTFLQISKGHKDQQKAYLKLKELATKYKSLGLARLAALTKTTGHFDKVIHTIENMVLTMKGEEADDIKHKDRCDGTIKENEHLQEDLNYTIDKAASEIGRLQDDIEEYETKISGFEADINASTTTLNEMNDMRGEERGAFLQAMKDDQDAIALLEQAIVTLSKFYEKNGKSLAMAQKKVEPYNEPAPETWSGEYGGQSSSSEGIISILSMIKEDLEKEMENSLHEDGTSNGNYQGDYKALTASLAAQKESKAVAKTELAQLQFKLADKEGFKSQQTADLGVALEKRAALELDCAWVGTDFEDRRTKRKTEIEGLIAAKNYLQGVSAGGDAIPAGF